MSLKIRPIIVLISVFMNCAYNDVETGVSKDKYTRRRSRIQPMDSAALYERSNAVRHYQQIYIEDSLSVFWTRYPDPFCPSPHPYIDCERERKNYYCNLEGDIEIGLMSQESDSLLYVFREMSQRYRSFWICIAEGDIDKSELPDKYFFSSCEEPLDLVLIVNGRLKSKLPIGIRVPVGKYCLLSWSIRYQRLPNM